MNQSRKLLPAFLFIWLTVLLVVALCPPSRASNAINPETQGLIKKVCQTYDRAHSLSCKVTVRRTGDGGKDVAGQLREYFIVAEKPNKYFVQFHSTQGGIAVSNGKTVEYYMPKVHRYMTDSAPATIEDGIMAEEFALVTGATLFKSVLPQLLTTAPYDEIMKDVTVAGLLPDEVVDGTKCRHLLMKKSEHAVDLWIDAGKTPRLVKVKYGLAKTPSQSELALTYLYQNQLLDAPVSAAKFGPAHASDAVHIASFIDDPFKDLVGKPAPDAIVKMESGTSFKLSNLKDRVVVLDFWSTSCPPCVISMPIFAQESLRFKDQGVVFIPVNRGDSPSAIRAFMKQHGLTQSAVDADDRLAMLYEAEALPEMVFIGKDGIVKGVHSGIRQDFKETFISDLKDVLAGKKVVH